MSNPRDFAANITNYIDNLLDLVAVVMNDALPKDMPVTDRVSLQDVVATIASKQFPFVLFGVFLGRERWHANR